MTQVVINSITGLNPPYDIYACNGFGLSCVLVASVVTPVPSVVVINLPSPQFDSAPAVGIKIVTSDGCEDFKVVYCTTPAQEPKQFQNLEFFEFMDGQPYYFQ